MKKLNSLLIFIVIIFNTVSIAWASGGTGLDLSMSGNKIIVSGVTSSGKTNQYVTMLVYNPNYSPETVAGYIKNAVAYTGTAITSANGAFSFEFYIDNAVCQTGDYTVRVTGSTTTMLQTGFYFANKDAAETALSSIAGITTASALQTAVLGENGVGRELGVLSMSNQTYYETYNGLGTNKIKVFELLIKNNSLEKTPEDFVTDFNKYTMLTKISIASPDTVKEILEANAVLLNIPLTGRYSTYLKTEAAKTMAAQGLINKSYDNEIMLIGELNNQITIAAAKSVELWADMKGVIIALNNENPGLGIDYSRFNALSENKQNNVYKYIFDRIDSITTVPKIKELFNSGVDSQEGGSSGGGGGGGGGSSGGYTPIVNNTVSTYESEPIDIKPSYSGVLRFSDLDDYEWAAEGIEYLSGLKVIEGYEDGTFVPARPVTREQFVKMLMVAFGLVDENADCNFSDVTGDVWSYKYVASANKAGIVNGIDGNTFGAEAEITREDLAVMMYRGLNYAGFDFYGDAAEGFTDENNIAEYALDAVNDLKKSGIISGVGDGTFLPLNNTTRAEAATIIYKALRAWEGTE